MEVKRNSKLNIQVVDQENGGVSAARNTGIKHANGNFICFCDVDDEVTESYLSSMKAVLESNEVDLVICKSVLIQIDGTVVSKEEDTGQVTIKDSDTCLRDFLYGRMTTGCWTLMVRKDLILENDLWFAEGYKYSEDLHMVWRLIACSNKVAYLDERLYIYQLQENSATAKFNDERLHGYKLMKNLESFFDKKAPSFAPEFQKYGASRLLWSITWQASTNYNDKQFKKFIQENKVKQEMKKLLTFNSRKVSLSAFVFLISPSLFRQLAIKYGKKYIH